MKGILFSIITVISISTYAQNVGVGTAAPAAKLDVTSSNSGILIPRVVLTSTATAAPVSSPITSMMVYNSNTAGAGATAVTPGYYYWNGSAWVRMTDAATPATNIYTADGTLTGPRTVTMGGNILDFTGGNVGIGTAAPGYQLDIAGKTGIDGANDGAIYMSGTKNTNRGLEWYYGANDRYGMAQATGGNTALYTSASYGPSFISFNLANAVGSSFTELMRISHNGNVGIGTTNPGAPLEINSASTCALASGILNLFQPNMPTSSALYIKLGTGLSNFNEADIAFNNAGSGSSSNNLSIGFYGGAAVARFYPSQTTSSVTLDPSLGVVHTGDIDEEDENTAKAGIGGGTHAEIIVADLLGSVDIQGKLFYSSDARIKKDKTPSDNQADLDLLKKIRITNYRYVDYMALGSTPQKKVIAQQVKEVYPQAVTAVTGFIPNIYCMSGPVTKDAATLSISLNKCEDVKVGDKLRFYADGKVKEELVTEVSDSNIKVSYTDKAPKAAVFLFGTEVNDFLQVDYEAISMLNVSATQALAKQLYEEQKRNQVLEQKVSQLQEKNSVLESRNKSTQSDVDKLKASVESLQQIVGAKAQK
jgi:hypothetical protein